MRYEVQQEDSHMSLTDLINGVLGAAKAEQLAHRPEATMSGWRALIGQTELPSLGDDLTRVYRSYGKDLTPERIYEVVHDIPSFRAVVDISYKESSALCGIVFELSAGSFLVVFPNPADLQSKIVGYVMGDTTLKECSEVSCKLVDVFEERVMPAFPHAGELIGKI